MENFCNTCLGWLKHGCLYHKIKKREERTFVDGKKVMMNLKFVFTVSLVAIMAVTAANADIASTTYYTAGSNISISAESNGKKTISASVPTVNNATLTIQKNGATVDTFTANAATNKTVNITVPTGKLADESAVTSALITDGTIVNADISGSAAIAQSKISGLTDALNAKQDASTAVKHTASTAVGGAARPVYVASSGQATAVTGVSVPVGAATATSSTTWASIWIEE